MIYGAHRGEIVIAKTYISHHSFYMFQFNILPFLSKNLLLQILGVQMYLIEFFLITFLYHISINKINEIYNI